MQEQGDRQMHLWYQFENLMSDFKKYFALCLFVQADSAEWHNCTALTMLLQYMNTHIDITLSSLVPEYLFNHP